MKKCTVILTGTLLTDAHLLPEFQECSERAGKNASLYGGKVLSQFNIRESLGSGKKQDFLILVEYPTYEDALAAHSNPEYDRITQLRQKVFSEFNVQIAI